MRAQEDNRRQLEAERLAAENLKEMKAAQYEADLAAHKRRERMHQLKAKQERKLQETVWMDVMDWNEHVVAADIDAKAEAKRLFTEQLARKKAEEKELRQRRLHQEQKMKLDLEEKRAMREESEAKAIEDELRRKAEAVKAAAAEVKVMKKTNDEAITPYVQAAPDTAEKKSKEGNGEGGNQAASAKKGMFSWGKGRPKKASPVQVKV